MVTGNTTNTPTGKSRNISFSSILAEVGFTIIPAPVPVDDFAQLVPISCVALIALLAMQVGLYPRTVGRFPQIQRPPRRCARLRLWTPASSAS
jgi:hypothetical protein